MNGIEVLEKIMEENGIEKYTVSKYLGVRVQDILQNFKQKDCKVELFEKILESIGYGIEIKKIGYKRVSRKYIDNLLTDRVHSLQNEREHRNSLFCTEEGGCTVIDNRTGKMLRIDFADRKDEKTGKVISASEQLRSYLEIANGL